MSEEKKQERKSFDMYSFFSRKDVILAIAFIIAFLIFSVAILLNPRVV